MAFEEQRSWIMLVVAIGGWLTYLVLVLRQSVPLTETSYAPVMIGTIVGAIVVTIIANIVVGMFVKKGEDRTDERDRRIHQFSEYTGQSFLVIGAVVALALTLADVDQFWIANAIYLGFVLSAVLSSIAKICSYRFGVAGW